MAIERIETEIIAKVKTDKASAQKSGEEVVRYARDTKKKLDPLMIFNLQVKIAQLQSQLEQARAILKKAKKDGDKELELSARIDVHTLQSNLTEAKRHFNNYVNTGDTALSRLQAKFDQVGGTGLAMAKKIGAGLTTAFGIRAVSGAINSFEEARSNIVRMTGATGELADTLNNDLVAVLSRVPDSIGDVSESIGIINARLDLTGPQLQNLTEQLLWYSRVNKTDVATSTDLVTKLMAGMEISAEDASLMLDKLTVASQNSRIEVGQLVQNILDSGVSFQELGFSVEKQIALFANLTKVGGEPREMVTSLDVALKQLAREGFRDAESAFDEYLRRIEEAPTILEAVDIATQVFGRSAAKIADDIFAGNFHIEERVDLLGNSEGALKRVYEESLTARERFQLLSNQFKANLIPVIERILNIINPLLQRFNEWISTNPKLTATLGVVATTIGIVGGALMALGGPITVIIASLGVLTGAVVLIDDIYRNWGDTTDILRGQLEDLQDQIENVQREIDILTEAYENGEISVEEYDARVGELNNTLGQLQEEAQETERKMNSFGTYLKVNLSKTLQDIGGLLKAIGIGAVGSAKTMYNAYKDATNGIKNLFANLMKGEIKGAWDFSATEASFREMVGGIDNALKGGVGGGGISEVADDFNEVTESADEARKAIENALKKPSGGGGKAKDELKELSDEVEKLAKERVDELKKQWRSGFDQINKDIDTSKKELEKYNAELAKLNEQMAKLGEDERGSLASRVATIDEQLKEGNLTRDERMKLEAERAEAFADMSDDEIEALEKQIAIQKEYNALTDIGKIKRDFKIRRELLEQDIADKQKQIDAELENQEKLYKERFRMEKLFTAIFQEEIDIKKQKDLEFEQHKKSLEARITSNLKSEADSRIAILRRVQYQAIATANAMARAGMAGGGSSSNITVNNNVSNTTQANNITNQVRNFSKGVK